MKLFLAILAVGLVAAEVPISTDYHADFGIAEAARIKAAEEALDFDGNSRIIGGSAANLGQFPFLGGLVITLTTGQTSVCGSSLIRNNRIVTAAHCWRTSGSSARQFVVVFGSVTLFSGGTRVTTTNVRMHPNYNMNWLTNDVAIGVIPTINLNNNINTIALATGNNQFIGSWGHAAGFGRTGDNVGIGNNQRLSHVTLPIVPNVECSRVYGTNTVIASTLCVSTTHGGSTCGGDSGGPLTVGSGNNRLLVGITSFGHVSGCQRSFPAGFARVTSFATWINQNM